MVMWASIGEAEGICPPPLLDKLVNKKNKWKNTFITGAKTMVEGPGREPNFFCFENVACAMMEDVGSSG